ncbi:2-hydroxy-palmitic acid dioxygenase mpo1 [Linum perenne]
MVFVWPILLTALLILYFTPSLPIIPKIDFSLLGIDGFLVFNVGFLLTLIYGGFYICLDRKAGSLAAMLLVLCWLGSCFLGSWLGFSVSWKVVVVAQIVCWAGQFIGHGVFEKRAPSLLDNLIQAFLMAPFFVLLEVIGYPLPSELVIFILLSSENIFDCRPYKPSLVMNPTLGFKQLLKLKLMMKSVSGKKRSRSYFNSVNRFIVSTHMKLGF